MIRTSIAGIIFFAALAAGQVQSQGPVRIDTGRVSGALGGSSNTISVYKGIPFVAPPVGELRWKAPQPAKDWAGVFEATKFSPIPPQRQSADPQSEDSLYLNVWTPAKSAAERLPVMVWIYGGGFTYGSASTRIYDGVHLAEHGVVVVTFNYRLNVLAGFAHPLLSKESGHGSGDYGMLDQIAALQWVKRNIKAFGGDENNVTIFGESAGGISVSALVVSPLTNGLFQKAIVESGSAATITPLASAEATGKAMVSKMGLDGDPNLLATLRGKAWKDLPDAQNYRGGPVVDGYAFTDHPAAFWAQGKQHNVPMIIGYNHDEATFFLARDGEIPKTVEEYQASVKQRFGDSAGAVLSLYPAKSPEEVYWQEVAIRTDSRFGTGARAQLRGEFTVPSKAWSYHFSYLAPGARDPKRGVSHASELAFVFGTIPAGSTKETQDISEAMMSYWTQFAKTGDPNQAGLPQWPAFQKGSESYLEIAAPMHAGKDLNKEKADLFSRIVRPAPRN
ncbi:MAG TPA: carboxylesterase/lipase family protein [Bryobacteraceae bacterium]|nr:carboxylesterase/lipase family protein [Bryobacteraceae bacterium]